MAQNVLEKAIRRESRKASRYTQVRRAQPSGCPEGHGCSYCRSFGWHKEQDRLTRNEAIHELKEVNWFTPVASQPADRLRAEMAELYKALANQNDLDTDFIP